MLGIEARSFSEDPLPVAKHNREMSEDNRGLALAGALNGLFPHLPRYLRPKVIPQSYDQFFGQLVREAFRLRRAKHQERNDFINHLLDMQQEHQLSEEQLTSHAMTFMFDGLDTTSSTISHCLLLVSTAGEEEGTRIILHSTIYILLLPPSSVATRIASSNCKRNWTGPAPRINSCPISMCSTSYLI